MDHGVCGFRPLANNNSQQRTLQPKGELSEVFYNYEGKVHLLYTTGGKWILFLFIRCYISSRYATLEILVLTRIFLVKIANPLPPTKSSPPFPCFPQTTVTTELEAQNTPSLQAEAPSVAFGHFIKMEIGTTRCCLNKKVSWSPWNFRTLDWEKSHNVPYNLAPWNLRTSYKRLSHSQFSSAKMDLKSHSFWKTYSAPVGLEESSSLSEDAPTDGENSSVDSPQQLLDQPMGSDELKALLADSERTKLMKKLSEANQQNRFLKRQLYGKENSLVNFKSELAVMELEIQALVSLAEEIAKSGIPEGSRKINGKYIQSHLLARLDAVHEKLKEQIKDVEATQSKEVPLFWCGMAESVQVMGSFDGWSQGEHLSPEYTGSFTRFSTTLMLRPGRYEIKFLVDGEWQLSPEYPTTGEGLTKNNLLIVE